MLCPRAVEFHLVASEQLTTRGSVARATNHHARSERAAPQCLLENNSPRPLPIGARCDRDYGLVPTFKVTQLLRLSKQAPCELIARRARTFLPRAAGWWWWCELVCGALRLHWGRVWFGALGCSNVHHSALAVVSSREHLRTERETTVADPLRCRHVGGALGLNLGLGMCASLPVAPPRELPTTASALSSVSAAPYIDPLT